ncbi:hypothetical protein [Calothrix sp. UHCC 0171]|uniref:hypothetical protein n=1 Tax=Calothrix sp. UHCC 0171 TaxID=3110245 RepID=UPI002B20E1A3|nr:hypothetical protein [Calothrix sp. UHCC 0171]MEA5574570.1 hypothetical protein [Calothrix sp. UHCC 0171]
MATIFDSIAHHHLRFTASNSLPTSFIANFDSSRFTTLKALRNYKLRHNNQQHNKYKLKQSILTEGDRKNSRKINTTDTKHHYII